MGDGEQAPPETSPSSEGPRKILEALDQQAQAAVPSADLLKLSEDQPQAQELKTEAANVQIPAQQMISEAMRQLDQILTEIQSEKKEIEAQLPSGEPEPPVEGKEEDLPDIPHPPAEKPAGTSENIPS